jgi:hypothetical protein
VVVVVVVVVEVVAQMLVPLELSQGARAGVLI